MASKFLESLSRLEPLQNKELTYKDVMLLIGMKGGHIRLIDLEKDGGKAIVFELKESIKMRSRP